MTKPLNKQQQLFVANYIIHFNGTKAAIDAEYSPKTADQQASRMLKDERIIAAIADAMEARVERTKVDADFVLTQSAEMVKADVADIIDDDGTYKPIKQWPLIWRQMLTGVDIKELFDGPPGDREQVGEVAKLKFIDRMKALDMVGRHVDVGAFRENLQVEVVDKASIIARARERANRSRS